ncbi:MAG: DUF938 domain-containing protein [Thalassotalea sp.]|nr:DUF938 domain-containing protein [Thalassotalea sp.]MDG2394094.1 DUF938 domain-containing protein [Thalassotalea sp.]
MNLNEHNLINFSPSCERNQEAIFERLLPYIPSSAAVLEIGSYSGQHAIHFCQNRPDLIWQASDQSQYISGLKQNFSMANLANIISPIEINVDVAEHWPKQKFDVIYSANTLHIMSWQQVKRMFDNMATCLKENTLVCIYGPFKYNSKYTSASNEEFQQWLQARDPLSGVRDFEAIALLAQKSGLQLVQDIKMPANNQLLIWQKE